MNYILLFIISTFINGCPSNESVKEPIIKQDLDPQWYQGKAEVSTYKLSQNRYNDVHEGEVVMIFVTEDFLPDLNVKNDNYKNKNSVGVLKNNRISRFTTGVYDYSMFTSVYNTEDGNLEKITLSSQDWCGQSWMQISDEKKKLNVSLRSYFESEGDQNYQIENILSEDELFNLIRINPRLLPKGESEMIISASIARLLHVEYKSYKVECKLMMTSSQEGENIGIYTVSFPSLNRSISIKYKDDNIRQIESWEDSYPSVFDKKIRTTRAELKATIWSDYWSQNSKSDIHNRSKLGLSKY